MNIDLAPEVQSVVQQAIESGWVNRPEDAVQEALSLWVERERRRSERLSAVDKSEASLARGKGRRITSQEESRDLATEITQQPISPSTLLSGEAWERELDVLISDLPETPLLPDAAQKLVFRARLMRILLDTNVLLRIVQRKHAAHR